jgi:hypothetical protein
LAWGVAIGLLTLALVAPAAARGQAISVPPSVDLLFDAGAQIDGAQPSDVLGNELAVGDMSGDGTTDIAASDVTGVKVFFGPVPALLDARTIGAGAGYAIEKQSLGVAAVESVAAGDVNGDGKADVVFGMPGATPLGRSPSAGHVEVVYGKSTTGTIDPTQGSPQGFSIYGAGITDEAGAAVAVGDTNGDGLSDIIIGAPGDTSVFVVFGKAGTSDVDLNSLGSQGYQIDAAASGHETGASVANAGDVNGDGLTDILIGADEATVDGDALAGAAYVVHGKTNTLPVDLDTLGGGGYHIEAADAGDRAGAAVANAGDVNLDGRPDQLVGATLAGSGLEGAAYVVFGKTSSSTVELGALGSGGYALNGAFALENTGKSLAGDRDVNGDGRDDVLVGARVADNNGRTNSGSTYVVYGKGTTRAISLGGLTSSKGYRIDGPASGTQVGVATALSGNLFGSTLGSDVVLGAPNNSANGRASSGSVYVIDEGPATGAAGTTGTAGIDNVNLGSRTFFSSAPARGEASASQRRTVLRYRLRRPARVTLRLHRILSGRRSGRGERQRCRRSSRALRRARRRTCRRFVLAARRVIRHRTRGRKVVRLSGRIGGRRLRPGSYVLSITARERNGREWGPARTRIRVKRTSGR